MAFIEYIDGCDMNAHMHNKMNCPNNGNSCINSRPLAMAYVPYQEFEDLYDDTDALYNGTLFKKLNLPFIGRRDMR